MPASELDLAVRQIALIDAVQPVHIGVAAGLQHRPVMRHRAEFEAVTGAVLGRRRNLRGIPHDLLGHAAPH